MKDVPAHEFIAKLAEHLKKNNKIKLPAVSAVPTLPTALSAVSLIDALCFQLYKLIYYIIVAIVH